MKRFGRHLYARKSLLLHVLIGGLLGFFILHPAAMVFGHLMHSGSEGVRTHFRDHGEISTIILMTFRPHMFWWSVFFTMLGGGIGGYYHTRTLRLKTLATESRLNARLFRNLIDQSNDAIMIVSPKTGRFLDVNERALAMYGYSRQEFLTITTRSLEAGGADEEPWTTWLDMAHRKPGTASERTHQRKDKSTFAVELSHAAVDHGAKEYLVLIGRDVTARRMAEKERLRLTEKLEEQATRDSHTDLFNHRYFESTLEQEFTVARESSRPLALIMLDIDYFKSVNDVYGHGFGDIVLRQVARTLASEARPMDTVARYGGEEFMFLAPGMGRVEAVAAAQGIVDTVNAGRFGSAQQFVRLKISGGVAAYPDDKVIDGSGLEKAADRALRKAKEDGGNRVYSLLDVAMRTPLVAADDENLPEAKHLKAKVEKLTKRANQGLEEAIYAFARTIDAKDHCTGDHVENTVRNARATARELDLPDHEIENIGKAAVLHDLGKVGVTGGILGKPGELTAEEYEEIKKHPEIGVEIIRPIQSLQDLIPLILYHHERWDGKGYPQGLEGEEIPIGARIITIADTYDALVSDRPYRKAISQQEAARIIQENAGAQFDPNVVAAFLVVIEKRRQTVAAGQTDR